MITRPQSSTLFPYTTLFRSIDSAKVSRGRPRLLEHFRALHTLAGLAKLRREMSMRWNRQMAERRSEEHTSELQLHSDLVCRLLLEKKKKSSYLKQIYKCGRR